MIFDASALIAILLVAGPVPIVAAISHPAAFAVYSLVAEPCYSLTTTCTDNWNCVTSHRTL